VPHRHSCGRPLLGIVASTHCRYIMHIRRVNRWLFSKGLFKLKAVAAAQKRSANRENKEIDGENERQEQMPAAKSRQLGNETQSIDHPNPHL